MANFAPYGTAKTFDGDQIPGVAAEGAGILYTDRRQFYIEPNTYKELWTSVTPFLSGLMERGQTRSDLMDPMFKMCIN